MSGEADKSRLLDEFDLLNRHSPKPLLEFCLRWFLLAQDVSLETRQPDANLVEVHAVFTIRTVAAGDSGVHFWLGWAGTVATAETA